MLYILSLLKYKQQLLVFEFVSNWMQVGLL